MKLYYHSGKNFGDAINPAVFEHFLGDVFDDDSTEVIVGIGSILGLFKKPENCKKVYVFSSGYAKGAPSTYGLPVKIDNDFDIICVRGKGTAKAMGISSDLAVADGALLLPIAWPLAVPSKKKYSYSFMPHSGTLDVFEDWQKILSPLGIYVIDPRKDPEIVMAELMDSEVLIAEAMHGGIIADSYRIPWIPVKTIVTINENKWADYCESVELDYNPTRTDTLYSISFLKIVFANKLRQLKFLSGIAANVYYTYQSVVKVPRLKKQFEKIKNITPILSNDEVFLDLQNQLLEKMAELKVKIAK